jgi:uncharacterized protein
MTLPPPLPPVLQTPLEAGPVEPGRRIVSIDVLRGFALLGILIMNIQSFGLIEAAYFNPRAYGDFSGANFWAWLIAHVLADQKFMSIFSMLFGAGVLIMADRADTSGRSGWSIHLRRMLWLGLAGLAHAYFIWFGDVLFLYAICGLLIYPLRGLSPRRLVLIGSAALVIPSAFVLLAGLTIPHWPEEVIDDVVLGVQPSEQEVAEELAAYRGSWLDQMAYRASTAAYMHFTVLPLWGLWRAGGLMLIGMALFKWRFLTAELSTRAYLGVIVPALLVGTLLTVAGVLWNLHHDFDPLRLTFGGMEFNYWGSAFCGLGYAGIVMLLCRKPIPMFQVPLAAVGRTALSNYLLQSLLCTGLFYGHGLGWFGHLSRSQLWGVVGAVWVVQIVASVLWLRRFRFGPLEYAWRRLTYGWIPSLPA